MTATTATSHGRRRGWHRRAGLAAVGAPLVLVVTLTSCGGGGGGGVTGPTTVTIKPNSYATVPAVTASTAPPAGETPGTAGEDGRVPGTQQYTIRRGDVLSAIASKLGISDYNDICEINRWDRCPPNEFYPGTAITIPPNAFDVATIDEDDPDDDPSSGDDDATETTEQESSTGGAAAGSDGKCPDGSVQGTYDIVAGDFPQRVAEKLDLTVDQLAAANASNPAYQSFIVGQELLLPCDDD